MTKADALERMRNAAGDFLLAVKMGNADVTEIEELERAAERAAAEARRAGCSWREIMAAQWEAAA